MAPYEVRFACIDTVEGVKCTLDGEVKYSDELGLCSFFDVSAGPHTYSVFKEGLFVVDGRDPWNRRLPSSGTTVIEVPDVPGGEWPQDQPWLLAFTFAEAPPTPPITQSLAFIGLPLFVGVGLNLIAKYA